MNVPKKSASAAGGSAPASGAASISSEPEPEALGKLSKYTLAFVHKAIAKRVKKAGKVIRKAEEFLGALRETVDGLLLPGETAAALNTISWEEMRLRFQAVDIELPMEPPVMAPSSSSAGAGAGAFAETVSLSEGSESSDGDSDAELLEPVMARRLPKQTALLARMAASAQAAQRRADARLAALEARAAEQQVALQATKDELRELREAQEADDGSEALPGVPNTLGVPLTGPQFKLPVVPNLRWSEPEKDSEHASGLKRLRDLKVVGKHTSNRGMMNAICELVHELIRYMRRWNVAPPTVGLTDSAMDDFVASHEELLSDHAKAMAAHFAHPDVAAVPFDTRTDVYALVTRLMTIIAALGPELSEVLTTPPLRMGTVTNQATALPAQAALVDLRNHVERRVQMANSKSRETTDAHAAILTAYIDALPRPLAEAFSAETGVKPGDLRTYTRWTLHDVVKECQRIVLRSFDTQNGAGKAMWQAIMASKHDAESHGKRPAHASPAGAGGARPGGVGHKSGPGGAAAGGATAGGAGGGSSAGAMGGAGGPTASKKAKGDEEPKFCSNCKTAGHILSGCDKPCQWGATVATCRYAKCKVPVHKAGPHLKPHDK